MPRIKVNTEQLNSLRSKLSIIKTKSSEAVNNIGIVKSNLDWQVSSRSNIDARLSAIQKRMRNQADLIDKYVNFLNTVNSGFITTDGNLRNQSKELMYRMSQVTAGMNTAGTTQSKIDYEKNEKLKNLLTISSLFGQAGIASVNLPGLSSIIKTGFNAVSGASSVYNAGKGAVDTVFNVGKGAVKSVGNVVSKTSQYIQENIGEGGKYEHAWAVVKTTTKVVGATGMVVASGASIAFGNPVGWMGVTYGVNSLIGAGADISKIRSGEYNQLGQTNVLKTTTKAVGGAAGQSVGAGFGYIVGGSEGAKTGATIGRSAGSAVGSIAYTAGELYSIKSVGKTVVSAKPGNIKNALGLQDKTIITISKAAKPSFLHDNTAKSIDFFDAVAKDDLPSYVTGKVIGGSVRDGIKDVAKEVSKSPFGSIQSSGQIELPGEKSKKNN